jgi:hypothetical protein
LEKTEAGAADPRLPRNHAVVAKRAVARGSVAALSAREPLAGDRAEPTWIRTLRPALTVVRTWVAITVVARAIGPSARVTVAVHPLAAVAATGPARS